MKNALKKAVLNIDINNSGEWYTYKVNVHYRIWVDFANRNKHCLRLDLFIALNDKNKSALGFYFSNNEDNLTLVFYLDKRQVFERKLSNCYLNLLTINNMDEIRVIAYGDFKKFFENILELSGIDFETVQ